MPEPLRCRDKRFPQSYPHVDWFIGWCPHADRILLGDLKALDYDNGRCLNWLRVCEKTEKVVVHNKKCDVSEVKEKFEASDRLSGPQSVHVIQRKSGRYAIEGRHGRYDGLDIWQTLQCGRFCPHYRVTNRKEIFGVCIKGVAWKIIENNRPGRKLRKCQVIRVDRSA